jgi:DNA-binding transcriptional MerR regulator
MGQGTLFDSNVEDLGYRGPVACKAAGITYRQLDYWARTSLVDPSLRSASGSGSTRLYSFQDILFLRVVKSLLDTGVSLPNIRAAIQFLRESEHDPSTTTLVSDGSSIYACTDDNEVIDLLKGGQGMFGIAITAVTAQVNATLTELPAEDLHASTARSAVQPLDELAKRRKIRKVS